jgi:uncharacterized membrane protein YtjA (UPF0391 family)
VQRHLALVSGHAEALIVRRRHLRRSKNEHPRGAAAPSDTRADETSACAEHLAGAEGPMQADGPRLAERLVRGAAPGPRRRGKGMLYWAAVFFVIAIAAAFFGFGGIAVGAAGIAKVLFLVFLVFAVVSLLLGRRPPVA